MKLFKYLKFISILIGCLILTNCGFKLKGTNKISVEPKYIMINYYNNYNHLFYVCLRQQLQKAGFIIIEKKQQYHNLQTSKSSASIKLPPLIILDLKVPIVNHNINSCNSFGEVISAKIDLSMEYKMLDQHFKILAQDTIERHYVYTVEPNKILANHNERQQIVKDLTLEIILGLINKLILAPI